MTDILNFSYNHPDTLLEQLFLFFISFFFCILFLQSGLDKLVNWNDNLNFFKDHFNKTIFQNFTFISLAFLMFLECLAGLIFSIVLISVSFAGFSSLIIALLLVGIIMSNFIICCLFLGQRMANDYAGAANLVIYFLVSLLSLFVVM
ncbi:MAG: DoxX family protein [Flavobacteriales bacterium]|nr:DoxX family protein [Flavobacteriales bacterium]|tara:strand:+ start:347 stop:787 length:441 start_codon:yes stop_codon:yes gene_type:complete